MPPEPDQLFTLAGVAVCAAKEHGKKKASNQAERAHILLPRSLDLFEADDNGDYMHVTHRFIGRIERTDYRRWSMRLIEPYWVNTEEESSSYRTIFAFEWTKEDVITATKKIILGQPEDIPDYGLQPVTLDDRVLQPDFLNAMNQHQAVSGADCERLIDDVREFASASLRSIEYNH